MTSEIDIYRSAHELIKQHGDAAPIHAAMRVDSMLEKRDVKGQAVWRRILKAVEVILADWSSEGQQLH